MDQFKNWFAEANAAQGVAIPEAVNLATASLPSGRVSSRTVLFKELERDGSLVVYSNWGTSKKSRDIKSNPHAALTFFWPDLERQIRVEGTTEFMSNEDSQVYFDTRPRASRIGAWASPQSESVQTREDLDALYEEQVARFKDQEDIPCPPHWGGLKVKPLEWEFWQGRPGRFHDRFTYTRESAEEDSSDSVWTIKRLAP